MTKNEIKLKRYEIKAIMQSMLGTSTIKITDNSKSSKFIFDINWQIENQCLDIRVEGFKACINELNLPVGEHDVTVLSANPSEFGFVIKTRELSLLRVVFCHRPECNPGSLVGYEYKVLTDEY